MANYFYKGKEDRSRSDRDRDVKLLWAHTVTLKPTDINFRVTDSVARWWVIHELLLVPNRWNQTLCLVPTVWN